MNDILSNVSVDQLIALIVVGGMVLLQVAYYFVVYAQPVYRKVRSHAPEVKYPVSIIICAKNEIVNLRNFLTRVLEQDYEDFEVIVVNDCSEDETEMLLADMEQTYKNLRHTTIEPDNKFQHGKKLAITIGIKSAKNEYLVFTDADCYPESRNWLKELMAGYGKNTDIVLAYGKYESRKGLLNKIVRYDTLMVGLNYLGMAMLGKPYMGVGRNLSYKKSLFFAGRGFRNHYHVLSGDDDLFINENANRKNTCVVISHKSYTSSVPPLHFGQYIKQKKRHLSSSKYYKTSDKLLLGVEPFSRLLFYLAIIYLALSPLYLLAIGAYVLRLMIQLIIIKLGMNKMGERGFLFLIPILDIFMPIFQLSLIFSNKINAKNRKWN